MNINYVYEEVYVVIRPLAVINITNCSADINCSDRSF